MLLNLFPVLETSSLLTPSYAQEHTSTLPCPSPVPGLLGNFRGKYACIMAETPARNKASGFRVEIGLHVLGSTQTKRALTTAIKNGVFVDSLFVSRDVPTTILVDGAHRLFLWKQHVHSKRVLNEWNTVSGKGTVLGVDLTMIASAGIRSLGVTLQVKGTELASESFCIRINCEVQHQS